MANFNTYQTRQFYVAKAVDSNVDTVGDIALKTVTGGSSTKAFFSYRNADDLLTATDVFDPKNITSLRMTTAAAMATPLIPVAFTIDAAFLNSAYYGKTFNLFINIGQIISYDAADSMTVVASVVGNSTNLASAAAFYKAMAEAIVKAMPKLPDAPFAVYMLKSGTATAVPANSYANDATSLALIPVAGKYIRGKLSKEALDITISSCVGGYADTDAEPWAKELVDGNSRPYKTVAALNSGLSVSISPANIPGVYMLADLEAFALGERGNVFRYGLEPNYVPPTYMIDLSKNYNVLSIEYFWQGGAENVQKSPRMIQIAAEAADSSDIVTSLYNSLVALTPDGVAAATADALEDLEDRVEDLETPTESPT